MDLSNADHKKLDVFLNTILDAYKTGEIDQGDARAALAHVFTAAAIGNETEVRSWLTPATMKAWRKMIDNMP